MNFDGLLQRRRAEREARRTRAREIRRRLREAGAPVFERYGVQKVVLYGSVAEDRCGPRSDVDLLVIPLANDRYWDLLHDLEEVLGSPVDLHTDRDDARFVRKVLDRGEVVYEAES